MSVWDCLKRFLPHWTSFLLVLIWNCLKHGIVEKLDDLPLSFDENAFGEAIPSGTLRLILCRVITWTRSPLFDPLSFGPMSLDPLFPFRVSLCVFWSLRVWAPSSSCMVWLWAYRTREKWFLVQTHVSFDSIFLNTPFTKPLPYCMVFVKWSLMHWYSF